MNERIKQAIDVLKRVEKSGQFYWLGVMVRVGEVTPGEAGFIITQLK